MDRLRKRFLAPLSFASVVLLCEAATPISKTPVVVRCLEGDCLLRRSGNIYIVPLEKGEEIEAQRGDTVMTLGIGSLLEVDFGERKGQAYLRDTALAHITQGAERIVVGTVDALVRPKELNLPEKNRDSAPTRNETIRILPSISAGNLSYFRDLAVDLVTPPPEGSLFLEKFPSPGKIVLRVSDSYYFDAFKERHSKWVLRRDDSEEKSDVSLMFRPLEGSSTQFVSEVEWSEPGSYTLLPVGPGGVVSPESALSITISAPGAWGTEIDKLIEGVNTDSGSHIEIETSTQ
jgi:hypothetical protein